MCMLYYIAIVLFAGMLVSKIVSFFKLPNVTGYLIAGLLIGPYVFNLVPLDIVDGLHIIAEAALGFIAFNIGSEFNFKHLKELGLKPVVITFFQAVMTFIVVGIVLIIIFNQQITFSILLAAISVATAPAATIMVIKQYKAKGPIVNTLLPVIAIDDALCIIIFGISTAIVKVIADPNIDSSVAELMINPIWEIIVAVAIGFALGIVLSFISRKVKGEDGVLNISIAVIFLGLGIGKMLDVSVLLLCMVIGATVANLSHNSNRLLLTIDRFTPPVFIAFFTIAGAELNFTLIKSVGIIGIMYVLLRVIGKFSGAWLGATVVKSHPNVKKYLGFTLLPQAGVAIGLAVVAESVIQEGSSLRAIVLCGILFFELIGPILTKFVLTKAKEISV